MLSKSLTDRHRLLRALVVGTIVSMLFSSFLATKEVISTAIASTLLLDFLIFIKQTWLADIVQTRQVFQRFHAKEVAVAERTIALVFLSVGLLSFCISELNEKNGALSNSVHIFISFIALFLTWLQLHNGFALYYAKKYFDMNPVVLTNLDDQKGFVFEGAEPTFSDFLYISYSIGLTYSMTDCGIKDSSVRRVVIIHCLSSFLFASTVLSIIFSLATQVS